MNQTYDYIILGAGIYGLYAAYRLSQKSNYRILLLEHDHFAFQRGSYINQARVHNGYHYPRSFSTAIKSANYFDRFVREFSFAINKTFDKYYAISSIFSLTNGDQFLSFCNHANIPCQDVHPNRFFKKGTTERVFETKEYAFDAFMIRDWFLDQLSKKNNVEIIYNAKFTQVEKPQNLYTLVLGDQKKVSAPIVLNSTYASINQILHQFGFSPFRIKYEICEIILVDVSEQLHNVGVTVMDGPFFSVMPFGLQNCHSLTAVAFTPHRTSYESLPTFSCQNINQKCTKTNLENCNTCVAKPESMFAYMNQLLRKYMKDSIQVTFKDSLFAIKPILQSSEIDDSRPTVIRHFSENPTLISVLSGKINTIYDLDEVLI